jgi:hypothetical protein
LGRSERLLLSTASASPVRLACCRVSASSNPKPRWDRRSGKCAPSPLLRRHCPGRSETYLCLLHSGRLRGQVGRGIQRTPCPGAVAVSANAALSIRRAEASVGCSETRRRKLAALPFSAQGSTGYCRQTARNRYCRVGPQDSPWGCQRAFHVAAGNQIACQRDPGRDIAGDRVIAWLSRLRLPASSPWRIAIPASFEWLPHPCCPDPGWLSNHGRHRNISASLPKASRGK